MSTLSPTITTPPIAWHLPARGRVGIACLIVAESSIFAIFAVAYLYYIGQSADGPTPQQVLELPILNTVCLLASSATIALAVSALRKGRQQNFGIWWLVTILLGAYFLLGTAREWRHLIFDRGLTIQTNLFGTTFYSLVGLHAFHVIAGLIMLSIVLLLNLIGAVRSEHAERTEVLAWYWHFVDAVWVVVFSVVYVIGR